MSDHPIKPWGNQVLVKMEVYGNVTDEGTKSDGGIIIPDEVAKKEQGGMYKGTIVAFGPLAFNELAEGESPEECAANWGCKLGDSFLSPRYPGQEFEEFKSYQLVPDHILKGGIA